MTEIKPVLPNLTQIEKTAANCPEEMSSGIINTARSAGSTIWDCTKAVAKGVTGIVNGVVDTTTSGVKYASALMKLPFAAILDIDSLPDKDNVTTKTGQLKTEG